MVEYEKALERQLRDRIKKIGGWCLKLAPLHIRGLPDRLCLLPGGSIYFIELKTTGEKARKSQLVIHKKLKKIGFPVLVIDRSLQIDELLREYET